MHIRFALVIITSLVTSASALGDQRCPKITRAATGAGWIFVDEAGMTLYTYRGDGRYQPRCLGRCAAAWPPLSSTTTPCACDNYDGWSVITRADGLSQWALDGHPLYRSAKDLAPGDMTMAGPAWLPATVPCPAAKSVFGILGEDEAYAVVGDAIAQGIEPVGELRRWCGIGIDELSIRAKISISDIKAQESGRRELGRTARIAIAEALGAPVYLFLR